MGADTPDDGGQKKKCCWQIKRKYIQTFHNTRNNTETIHGKKVPLAWKWKLVLSFVLSSCSCVLTSAYPFDCKQNEKVFIKFDVRLLWNPVSPHISTCRPLCWQQRTFTVQRNNPPQWAWLEPTQWQPTTVGLTWTNTVSLTCTTPVRTHHQWATSDPSTECDINHTSNLSHQWVTAVTTHQNEWDRAPTTQYVTSIPMNWTGTTSWRRVGQKVICQAQESYLNLFFTPLLLTLKVECSLANLARLNCKANLTFYKMKTQNFVFNMQSNVEDMYLGRNESLPKQNPVIALAWFSRPWHVWQSVNIWWDTLVCRTIVQCWTVVLSSWWIIKRSSFVVAWPAFALFESTRVTPCLVCQPDVGPLLVGPLLVGPLLVGPLALGPGCGT